ncbi:contact-dependent growth inhibition system immunity protein [Vibrio nigripulchritudo]|uniref:contact-dependent growth inhibition system immunity protein n=1 Tax=Vibrio nigripulchritudo TaxID=28173 RepID=UPI0003B1BA45|nr:contact-dependent growth inhibition system immunity protein [Vibrio nigripulchritudo]CCN72617.1 hypothetical protein VIBNISFn118_630007 [Vibrio nigripulchritudo SFn118]
MEGEFEYFFEAYFYQNWRADFETSLNAVYVFSKDESAESTENLLHAFQKLKCMGSLPQDIFQKMGGNFNPGSEGLSVIEWIDRASDLLERKSDVDQSNN